jgi:hypothetical protein
MTADAAMLAGTTESPEPQSAKDNPTAEIAALLGVLATLFLDNVRNLDDTVTQVTELVMREGRPSRELIVTLQSFDRLKQEFEALSGALSRYAESTTSIPLFGEERAQFGRDVINAISLADLKDRFHDRMDNNAPLAPLAPLAEPDSSELEIDIIF